MPKSAKSRRAGESKSREAGMKMSSQGGVRKSDRAGERRSRRIEERNNRRAGGEATSESRFMDLPRELRNMIYNCLVSQREDELLNNPQRVYRWFAIHFNFPFSILCVSRQVRKEFFEGVLNKLPIAFRTCFAYRVWDDVEWQWPKRETAVGKFAHGVRITVDLDELMVRTSGPASKRDWDDWERIMDLPTYTDLGVREVLRKIGKMRGMEWILDLPCMKAPESLPELPSQGSDTEAF